MESSSIIIKYPKSKMLLIYKVLLRYNPELSQSMLDALYIIIYSIRIKLT